MMKSMHWLIGLREKTISSNMSRKLVPLNQTIPNPLMDGNESKWDRYGYGNRMEMETHGMGMF